MGLGSSSADLLQVSASAAPFPRVRTHTTVQERSTAIASVAVCGSVQIRWPHL